MSLGLGTFAQLSAPEAILRALGTVCRPGTSALRMMAVETMCAMSRSDSTTKTNPIRPTQNALQSSGTTVGVSAGASPEAPMSVE
jgi:hypothetical protein